MEEIKRTKFWSATLILTFVTQFFCLLPVAEAHHENDMPVYVTAHESIDCCDQGTDGCHLENLHSIDGFKFENDIFALKDIKSEYVFHDLYQDCIVNKFETNACNINCSLTFISKVRLLL